MTSPAPETIEREKDVIARPIKEICRVYGVGKSLIYDRIADGTLRAKKAGKRTLVLEDSVRAWFEGLPVMSGKKNER